MAEELPLVHRRRQRPCRACRWRRWEESLDGHPDKPADHALGRSRGGFGSKFHLVPDGHGIQLTLEVTVGQIHESTRVESVMNGITIPQGLGRPRTRPKRLAADKGYGVQSVRDWLRTRGIKPVIPHKRNETACHDGRVKFDRAAYRQRAVVEQCVGWMK